MIPMLIVNTSDLSNPTVSDISNAVDSLGNSGVGAVALNNHATDGELLSVMAAAVNLNSGVG